MEILLPMNSNDVIKQPNTARQTIPVFLCYKPLASGLSTPKRRIGAVISFECETTLVAQHVLVTPETGESSG